MALIQCPECGKEISNQAPSCIHCGYPLNGAPPVRQADERRRKTKGIVPAVITLAALITILFSDHLPSLEIIDIRWFTGGGLSYISMFLCAVTIAVYLIPVRQMTGVSCAVITAYSIPVILLRLFSFPYAGALRYLTIAAILLYTAVYWLSACGILKNTIPLAASAAFCMVSVGLETFLVIGHGAGLMLTFFLTAHPTILYYLGTFCYLSPDVEHAYISRQRKREAQASAGKV